MLPSYQKPWGVEVWSNTTMKSLPFMWTRRSLRPHLTRRLPCDCDGKLGLSWSRWIMLCLCNWYNLKTPQPKICFLRRKPQDAQWAVHFHRCHSPFLYSLWKEDNCFNVVQFPFRAFAHTCELAMFCGVVHRPHCLWFTACTQLKGQQINCRAADLPHLSLCYLTHKQEIWP